MPVSKNRKVAANNTVTPRRLASPRRTTGRKSSESSADPLALQKVQSQLNSYRALQQIAQSLSSELKVEPLLLKILRSAQIMLQASDTSIFLHDPKTNELVIMLTAGLSTGLEGMRMPSDKGIAGWVFTHKEPLIVDDVSQDPRFNSTFDQSTGFKTDSIACVPLISRGHTLGVLEVVNKLSGEHFNENDLDILTGLASQSAIAIENAKLYESLHSERDRLLAVEEDVRKELARDLHDGLAQTIAAMVMNIRFVQNLVTHNELIMTQDELKNLESLSTRANRQVREVLFNQRPVILETQGLFPTLEAYVKRLKETGEVLAELFLNCPPVSLSAKADRTIFSIIQEAVGNAKKHARGSLVGISVETEQQQLIVKISDQGPGFDVHQIQSNYDQRGSLGLLNMQERAEQVNGQWRIESEIGKGTTVTLTVPIPREARLNGAKTSDAS